MYDSTRPRRRHVRLGNLCLNPGRCEIETHEPKHALPIPAQTTPLYGSPPGRHRAPTMPERRSFGYMTTELNNDPSNLVAACLDCNTKRAAR